MNSTRSYVVYSQAYKKQSLQDEFQKQLLDAAKYLRSAGYSIEQANGQRVITLEDAKHNAEKFEIFIGQLPRYVLETDLIRLFSQVGTVIELRLMVNFHGYNRGFAFLSYKTEEEVNMAVQQYDGYFIRENRQIGVAKSLDNRRLFIGSLPQHKTEEEIKRALDGCVTGIKNIIMYPPNDCEYGGFVNRGYVFVEFLEHRSATIARRLLSGGVNLWPEHGPISCDWADPEPKVDPNIMEKVKRLYIRNIPFDVTQEELTTFLSDYLDLNKIVKVHKMKDFAFLHFKTRMDAENAFHHLKVMQPSMGGHLLDILWSRPQYFSKEVRMQETPSTFCKSLPPQMRKNVKMLRSSYLLS